MRFEVTAISARADPVQLTIEAGDAAHAQRNAAARGYHVVAVRAADSLARWRPGRTSFALLPFAQELCALLAAGIGLVESLQTLAEKEERAPVRQVLDAVIRTVSAGAPLSAALAEHPAAFPALFVATVKAAEKTGDLPEALARFVAYRSQIDAVRKRVVAALIYPALLLATGQPISAALDAHGLTTPVALRMLRVGERSGRISELMARIARFHEDEIARAVEWFTRLFEPILMLAIGAVIGLIVVLMYVPVFELAGSLQ